MYATSQSFGKYVGTDAGVIRIEVIGICHNMGPQAGKVKGDLSPAPAHLRECLSMHLTCEDIVSQVLRLIHKDGRQDLGRQSADGRRPKSTKRDVRLKGRATGAELGEEGIDMLKLLFRLL